MPTDDDTGDNDDDGADSPAIRNQRERIRRLEAENTELKQKAEEAPKLLRQLAFAQAGLADSPMLTYFEKGYDGPIEKDAIREAATKVGLALLGGAEPPPERTDDLQQHQQMDRTSGQPAATDADAVYLRDVAEAGHDRRKLDEVMRKHGVRLRSDRD